MEREGMGSLEERYKRWVLIGNRWKSTRIFDKRRSRGINLESILLCEVKKIDFFT